MQTGDPEKLVKKKKRLYPAITPGGGLVSIQATRNVLVEGYVPPSLQAMEQAVSPNSLW